MPKSETISQQDAGFEWQGVFYPWKLSDTGKDLLLIDRITNMPVDEFFEVVEDEGSVLRGSILLAMIATSLRAYHHTWSIERIYRSVMELSLSEDIEMFGMDEEEVVVPLEAEVEVDPEPSTSLVVVSSPSPTPEESTSSEI